MPTMLTMVLLTMAAAVEPSASSVESSVEAGGPMPGFEEAAPGLPPVSVPDPASIPTTSLVPMIGRTFSHLRPVGSSAAALLATAAERSPIIADLLKKLERTDVVVYLGDLMPWSRNAPKSHLEFLSSASGARYLVIRIDRLELSPIERIASLGHELQHALEVAADPRVRDASGFSPLYKRIGWVAEEGRYESADARKVGQNVRKELLQRAQ